MSTLDADMAAHVQDAAEGLGVRVLVGDEVEEVLLDDEGAPRAVRAGGETIDADHVVMATGVKPAVGLAEGRRDRARPERRRRASTTTSAAPATTASTPPATAPSRGTACSSGR